MHLVDEDITEPPDIMLLCADTVVVVDDEQVAGFYESPFKYIAPALCQEIPP